MTKGTESDPSGVGPFLSQEGERSGEGAILSHAADGAAVRVVLVTGISGSGKSVALHALEDAGFFCVDNLPPELLRDFLRLETQRRDRRIAIAVDVRSAGSLPHLLPLLAQLQGEGIGVKAIFLESSVNPKLAKAVAAQTGAIGNLSLYGDTLGPAGSRGATYLGMELANANAMMRGFTGGKRGCR